MNDLIPKEWNYDESVKKMKPLVYKWKNMTVEMLNELCIASENLSRQGRPETGTNDPIKTWNDYCDEIGLSRRTVNRWLEQYNAENKKLIEAPKEKEIETEDPQTKVFLDIMGRSSKYKVTPVGIEITGELTYKEWLDLLMRAAHLDPDRQGLIFIGDLMVYWEKRREEARQDLEDLAEQLNMTLQEVIEGIPKWIEDWKAYGLKIGFTWTDINEIAKKYINQ